MLKYIKHHWQGLLISILIAELTGILSSLIAGSIRPVYNAYIKPPFSPPGWLFGVVWPLLYALMGIAAYLIYKSDVEKAKKNNALRLYCVQLFLNFMWSIVFFRFDLLWGALIVLLLLDIFVIFTMIAFSRINKTAMWLMLPYLLWILFATYLNAAIALLN